MLREQHKLVDRKGKYLGVLFTPSGVWAAIGRRDCWHYPLSGQEYARSFNPNDNRGPPLIQTITIVPSCAARGAVELWGSTPEEISSHEGFAFLPAIDYVAEAKSTARETEAPGVHLTAAREVSA